MPTRKRMRSKPPSEKKRVQKRKRSIGIGRILLSIAIVLIVAATVFLLVLRNGSDVSIVENAIGSFFSPVQGTISSAASSVKTFLVNQRNYGKLEAAYEELSRQNDQLTLELAAAEEATIENERLKVLLDAQSSYESLSPIYAKVIARDAGQWFSTFSINRGEQNGISVGMAVVNGDGLIGRVYQVGLNYADVMSIIDPRSKLGCLIQSTRDSGILRGGVSEPDNYAECYVDYLPNVNSIIPGDVVVTSGTDSLYPKGLTIGVVTQVSLNAGSQGNYAIVEPAVDFLHIEEVLVLRDIVEKTGDRAAVPTPSPQPTGTPSPSDSPASNVVGPEATEGYWEPPKPGDNEATPEPETHLETLPEDEWADM